METAELKAKLEDLEIEPELIEEAVKRATVNPEKGNNETVADLKDKLLDENDWRKRAALRARIISFNLEEGY